MSDTPRTDAMLEVNGLRCGCAEKPIDLCEQLERELAAVSAEREHIREWAIRCQDEMEKQAIALRTRIAAMEASR